MNEALARRYASALADVAFEQKNPEGVKRDLTSFVEAFYSSGDLRNFLETPAAATGLKRKVIAKLAERMELSVAARNFIYLIVDHRRTETLQEIQQAFGREVNARMGIAEAQVASARALSADEKRNLTAALERRTGKKIEAHFDEDTSLLGGAVVRVGSTVYDGSVREQLIRLREQLEAE
ncbi:MAG TPA: ATP synthase F1 subunit delta [Candidatus Acidoferrales bacterium]|nr:ATP synthase F1 subunit delta [Candidatus Acidoferrales bacterium]